MFDSIKNKFRRKSYDDMEDIRSNVVGNNFMNPEPDFPPRRPSPVEDDLNALADPRFAQKRFDDPVARHFEPPGFSSIDVREQPRGRDDYDILDRLNLIESQLSAIRSQTETINERLKNLETKLVRRY